MKLVKIFRGFKIKENNGKFSPSDGIAYSDYSYLVFNCDNELEFECDSIEECIENIKSY